MFGLGIKEVLIIAVITVILFGIDKSPQIIKRIVDVILEFKGLFQLKK
jgi:Sec-independent protein translocase protein TatA